MARRAAEELKKKALDRELDVISRRNSVGEKPKVAPRYACGGRSVSAHATLSKVESQSSCSFVQSPVRSPHNIGPFFAFAIRVLSSNPLDAHRKVYVSGVKGVEMDVLTAHFGGFGTVVAIVPHGRGVIVEFADHDGAQRVCASNWWRGKLWGGPSFC